MAQLPCIGLSWPLTKPPFGSCAIYLHHSVTVSNLQMVYAKGKFKHFKIDTTFLCQPHHNTDSTFTPLPMTKSEDVLSTSAPATADPSAIGKLRWTLKNHPEMKRKINENHLNQTSMTLGPCFFRECFLTLDMEELITTPSHTTTEAKK